MESDDYYEQCALKISESIDTFLASADNDEVGAWFRWILDFLDLYLRNNDGDSWNYQLLGHEVFKNFIKYGGSESLGERVMKHCVNGCNAEIYSEADILDFRKLPGGREWLINHFMEEGYSSDFEQGIEVIVKLYLLMDFDGVSELYLHLYGSFPELSENLMDRLNGRNVFINADLDKIEGSRLAG